MAEGKWRRESGRGRRKMVKGMFFCRKQWRICALSVFPEWPIFLFLFFLVQMGFFLRCSYVNNNAPRVYLVESGWVEDFFLTQSKNLGWLDG